MHNLLSKARAELAEECGFRLNFNLHSPCFKGTKQLGFFLRVSGGVFFGCCSPSQKWKVLVCATIESDSTRIITTCALPVEFSRDQLLL